MGSDKTSRFPSQINKIKSVLVARLRKKEIILRRTLTKSVEKQNYETKLVVIKDYESAFAYRLRHFNIYTLDNFTS